MRIKKYIDWEHYKFTLRQTQLNFIVICTSSACAVSVEHMNAKKLIIRSIYCFHVYYHIRRILKILEIPLPYENSFKKYLKFHCHMRIVLMKTIIHIIMEISYTFVVSIKLAMT